MPGLHLHTKPNWRNQKYFGPPSLLQKHVVVLKISKNWHGVLWAAAVSKINMPVMSRGPNEHKVPESMLTIIFNDQDQDVAPKPNTTK